MKKLRVGILDLITNTVREPVFQSRVMQPNFASIMPQVIGVWAEEMGHEVFYETFTGLEDLTKGFPEDLDVLFIASFSRASFLAYGISEHWRRKGVVTIMGGPHARSFSEHARQYFDYIFLLTDKAMVQAVLTKPEQHRPGVVLSAEGQPEHLPGVRARARFIDSAIQKGSRIFRMVPMLGSMGCPYTCLFCVDAPIPYQPLDMKQLEDDLRYVEERWGPSTFIGWHDPNFGVRFNDYLGVIKNSGTRLRHVAESSLSILSSERLRQLRDVNFIGMLPGVESWYECNNKGGAKSRAGWEKMAHVADHVNEIISHIPKVQTNFVLGLDSDSGDEPWEITKEFVRRAPGAFPGYSLISDFGNSPMSDDLRAAGRVLKVPYPLLDNNMAINVKLKNYSLAEFYDRVVDLMEATWSFGALARRFRANKGAAIKGLNFGRGMTEGRMRTQTYRNMRKLLDTDASFRNFATVEGALPPQFFFDLIRRDLGPYAELLPEGLLTPAGFVESVDRVAHFRRPAPKIKRAAGAGASATL